MARFVENPSPWKTMIRLSYKINTMVIYGLATQVTSGPFY